MNKNELERIFSLGCSQWQQKLSFYTIFEGWSNKKKYQYLTKKLSTIIQKDYHDLYYLCLYHLLTCSFCFPHCSNIIGDKVHPDLVKLLLEPRGIHLYTFLDLQNKLHDPKAYYFCLFWEKLHPVLQPVIDINVEQISMREVLYPSAAGASDKFPDQIIITIEETEIHLCFESNGDIFNIFLIGGTLQMREKIIIKLFFIDGSCQLLEGKEIAIGGMWEITTEKAQEICLIDFCYEAENSK
ncbi:hypothetical protein [Candidatus Uabimicrobium sp. HlEnr_7]|uniref:hypothetical protein n=1 Tax=Candidatus Uabimicrobium helgolandensis TaxID=3095367 RepID=UPI003556B058